MRLEQWEIRYKKATDTKGMVDVEEFNLMSERELKLTRLLKRYWKHQYR